MLLGLDVSHYDEQVDWARAAAAGAGFAIAKLSQGDYYRDDRCADHLAGAQAAGLRTGVYHWLDPDCAPKKQADFLRQCAAGLKFHFICLDVEQHTPWPLKKRGEVAGKTKTASYSARVISECARELAALLAGSLTLPVVIYTRVSFIVEYARPMLDWLPAYPLWLAQYPLLPTPPGKLTWATLSQVYPRVAAPLLPQGCPQWTFWQWSGDRLRLPGLSSALDLNFFNGDKKALDAFLGIRRRAGKGTRNPEGLRLA